MLRLGMTNPPFILQQLGALSDALNHPAVFAVLHLPVQSGSNAVLKSARARPPPAGSLLASPRIRRS